MTDFEQLIDYIFSNKTKEDVSHAIVVLNDMPIYELKLHKCWSSLQVLYADGTVDVFDKYDDNANTKAFCVLQQIKQK